MPAPTTTLLLLTPQTLVRADADRDGRVTALWSRVGMPGEDPAVAAELALRQTDARPGARLWVLSTDFWMQTMELPPAATIGVGEEDLARALAFEAEPFSGVSGLESRLAFRAIARGNGEHDYWLTQISSRTLAALGAVAERHMSRLAGAAHPAGLPAPLVAAGESAAPRGAWRRVELWPDLTFAMRGEPGGALRVQAFNTDPSQPGAAETASACFGPARETDIEEELTGPGVAPPATWRNNGATPWTLDGDEELRRWIGAWARHAAAGAVGTPVVTPPPKPMSRNAKAAIAIVAALVTCALCAGHYTLERGRLDRLKAELETVSAPARQLSALRTDITAAKREVTALKRELGDLSVGAADVQTELRENFDRWTRLMDTLATHRPAELAVESVETEGALPVVRGYCLTPEAANALAASLDDELRGTPWRVLPPEKHRAGAGSGNGNAAAFAPGGPWVFEIRVEYVAAAKAPAPSAARARRGSRQAR